MWEMRFVFFCVFNILFFQLNWNKQNSKTTNTEEYWRRNLLQRQHYTAGMCNKYWWKMCWSDSKARERFVLFVVAAPLLGYCRYWARTKPDFLHAYHLVSHTQHTTFAQFGLLARALTRTRSHFAYTLRLDGHCKHAHVSMCMRHW